MTEYGHFKSGTTDKIAQYLKVQLPTYYMAIGNFKDWILEVKKSQANYPYSADKTIKNDHSLLWEGDENHGV
jgi:hypothetical protein